MCAATLVVASTSQMATASSAAMAQNEAAQPCSLCSKCPAGCELTAAQDLGGDDADLRRGAGEARTGVEGRGGADRQ
jgi:hypothetical protein